ncbi:hypothetical protein Cfor_07019 [Coptotermes formosanus]|uniref:DUF4794 domain-containing protein n=1 Tax=Coptotermes formosanus TaxID=36987 RepID=A0A6L2Q7D4_COPFO|nr:hypothetical protein Cfor_07019 [Coptotermes formosanus]
MKALSVISAVLLAVVLVSAEPVSYGPPSKAEAAPYPPSGWRPSGRQFLLPVRQNYEYYLPPAVYGAPTTTQQPTTTEQETTTTTELPTTTEKDQSADFADGNGDDPSRAFRERDGQSSGVYHLLLPDGRLQRVTFTASPNQPSGALQTYGAPSQGYAAHVLYEDVEPIRSPVYTFSAPLIRIFK